MDTTTEASKAPAQRHGGHALEAGALGPGHPAGLQPRHCVPPAPGTPPSPWRRLVASHRKPAA